jgi:hypothetical protein
MSKQLAIGQLYFNYSFNFFSGAIRGSKYFKLVVRFSNSRSCTKAPANDTTTMEKWAFKEDQKPGPSTKKAAV